MYKVGILINENEVAHSVFADTPQKLRDLTCLKEQKGKFYRFYVFDKFNIHELFQKSNKNFLMSFDSLFLATNATNNLEIYRALVDNKQLISDFLAAGKGMFIASQKKLSAKEGKPITMVGFLPEKYDYAIVDRPEKSSAVGRISIVDSNNLIVQFPKKITEAYIEYHCMNNQFMHHKYRSFIIANNESQYDVVLADTTSSVVPPALNDRIDKSRKVLLVTTNERERVVVSTMALDWADHTDLIANILIYITEGSPKFAFMLKSTDRDEGQISSYILRAQVSKIGFREYYNLNPYEMIALPHNIFVFSPSYSEDEVNTFISESLSVTKYISVYHLTQGITQSKSFELYHYTNETSIDQITNETISWVLGGFYPSLWGKSVWTYSYALSMMKKLGVEYLSMFPFIYEELALHFCKKTVIDGSYDNVINATCKLLEILALVEPDIGRLTGSIFEKYPISKVKSLSADWLINKLDITTISEFDLIYVLVALYRSGVAKEDDIQGKISQKAKELIAIYRKKGYADYSNVALCQLLFLIKELVNNNSIPVDAAKSDSDKIAEVLAIRQDELGEWRNLSETAEVSLLLLEIEMDSLKNQNIVSSLSENISRAISRLYQAYDNKHYCWYTDINTTVKAIHAIGLYDQVKNYSANDFFNEIIVHYQRLHIMSNIENSNNAAHSYIGTIYDKDQLVRKLMRSSEQKKAFQWLFFGTFVIALCLGVMMILIFAGLTNEYVTYNGNVVSVLSRLFNEWQTEFIFGFIGILFGGAFTGIYSFVKRKTFRD